MKTNYIEELEYLKWYNIDEATKIRYIEDFYKIAHINYKDFIRNNWQISYWK